MLKFIEPIGGPKEYTLITAIAGEEPQETYASLEEIKDSKWLTEFFFCGEMEHEHLCKSMIKLIEGEDFQHNGQLIFSGDAGYMIIAKNNKIIDLYDLE